MKNSIRLISILLAVLLAFTCVACATQQENDTDTDAADTAVTGGDTKAEEDEGETLDVPLKNYDTTATFLSLSNLEWTINEVWVENDSADPIESAVFNRNLMIKDDYGITVKTNAVEAAQITSQVAAEFKSNTQDHIAIADALMDMVVYSRKGLVYDLCDVPNIDLTKSWWDNKAVEGLSIGNHVFYATGDIMITDNDATFILMFNKSIMNNKNILSSIDQGGKNNTTIYEMVDNHEWTFDMMLQMEKLASDQKDVLDPYADQVGFAMTGNVPFSLLYGGGFVSCVKDEDDLPKYALDVDLAAQICDQAFKIYGDKSLVANMDTGGEGVFENGKQCFGGGHALFFGEVLQCVSRLRGYDVDFGVIPYPMLTENQKDYYTVMNPIGGMVAIPAALSEDKAELAGALLEIMAAKSQKTGTGTNSLTTAYYDITLLAKGTKDAESEPMIDLILRNRVYDLGYVYGWGTLVTNVAGCISSGKGVASTTKKAESQFTKAIEKELKGMKIS